LSEFSDVCEGHQILRPVGYIGSSLGNDPTESFPATLKKELAYRTTFKTHQGVRLAIHHTDTYLHVFNHMRSHETLDVVVAVDVY
jgi:Integrase core domain